MAHFTILMPTFNNCRTLHYSVASVLAQDYPDFELFIVGDGCPDESRQIITSFARKDPRVRFFDNPKGPRHGELHRHTALQEASGRYVTYLSDDDLMLPQHLSTIMRYLENGYTFVHTLPVHVLPETMSDDAGAISIPGLKGKTLYLHVGGIEIADSVNDIRSGLNFLSLSAVTHSLEFYRSLPCGWRTTPEGIPTDLYMWQQCIAAPSFRATGIYAATIIHCGKDLRKDWSLDERLAEIRTWSEILERPNLSHDITAATFSYCMARLRNDQRIIAELSNTLSTTQSHLLQTQHELAARADELRAARVAEASTQATLEALHSSLTWQTAERIRRYPWLTRMCRRIARYLFH
jgi:GalNAc5-diNAcBac-PP-undecaprenol beta-1,3-glucosyltransferase